ncbi:MAG TPA: protein phosphatase 2C domain-containing protein [Bryobacteraceae bacterium]|nr:protein phosphatase 2C domain-containing protein [Bryobacteraceae bacterium]
MVDTGIRSAGASDPGRVRQNNEDSLHLDAGRGIFLVVDGIGGQAAGEKAASIAVERIRARLERQTGTAEQRLREAITVANNEILEAARAHSEWTGMACVLTAAVLENGDAVVGHVGDSRLYKVRGGVIRKITHDHSPVGQREDNQELTETEAMRHPRRNEVFRDVGSEEHQPDDESFIEIIRIPFEPDSALVLCSDGLSDQVPSKQILSALHRNAGNPEGAVQELIDAANRAGGKDNVTVLVIEGERFTAPVAPDPPAESGGAFLGSRWLLVACGIALALAFGFEAGRSLRPPPPRQPVVAAPRVLTAGTGAQFASISEALAEARPGDTVEVLGGEYREQVRLKSGVHLRSRIPHEAILRAVPTGNGPAVLAEGVSNATLSSFRILADAKMPLSEGVVLHDSDVEVDDVEVTGAGVGVEIRNGNPTLRANTIQDSTAEGVLISGSATPWISHNTILRNGGAGLVARDPARPVLVGNFFEANRKGAVELPPDVSMATVREMNFLTPVRPSRGGRHK